MADFVKDPDARWDMLVSRARMATKAEWYMKSRGMTSMTALAEHVASMKLAVHCSDQVTALQRCMKAADERSQAPAKRCQHKFDTMMGCGRAVGVVVRQSDDGHLTMLPRNGIDFAGLAKLESQYKDVVSNGSFTFQVDKSKLPERTFERNSS